MEWILRGRCWKFGDNITNEEALATSYTHHKDTYDPAKRGDWACGLLAAVDPDLTKKIEPGDIIVTGKRFAQGNMHWYWIGAMNYYGVGLVTESLPRGQFRNVVEVGLRVIPFFAGITESVDDGDDLEVDFQKAIVINHSKGKTLQGKALPPFILEIMEAGGSIAYLKKKRGLS
jgi:3-isopropylmalate/(R)-2-methylmalate dehydratase small subunit